MDVTILGLQNAGKTSLVRVLAVRIPPKPTLLKLLLRNAVPNTSDPHVGRRIHNRLPANRRLQHEKGSKRARDVKVVR